MEGNKSRGGGLAAFFESKGFYVVLCLCVAVIGVSIWLMLTGVGLNEDPGPALAVSGPAAESRPETGAEQPLDVPKAQAPEPAQETVAAEPGAAQKQNTAPQPVMGEAEPEPAPAGAESVFVWPVVGEIEKGHSLDALIYDRTMNDWRTHDGLDIGAALGTEVMAASSGTVSKVYRDDLYGTTVVLDHGGGLQSVYSGLAETPTVSQGDGVIAGEILGSLGNTALCEAGEAPHLHFAMSLNGNSVDPGDYLP